LGDQPAHDFIQLPTGRPTSASTGTVTMLSMLMTHDSGRPCSGPNETSDRMPRVVRVIGTHVKHLIDIVAV